MVTRNENKILDMVQNVKIKLYKNKKIGECVFKFD